MGHMRLLFPIILTDLRVASRSRFYGELCQEGKEDKLLVVWFSVWEKISALFKLQLPTPCVEEWDRKRHRVREHGIKECYLYRPFLSNNPY